MRLSFFLSKLMPDCRIVVLSHDNPKGRYQLCADSSAYCILQGVRDHDAEYPDNPILLNDFGALAGGGFWVKTGFTIPKRERG